MSTEFYLIGCLFLLAGVGVPSLVLYIWSANANDWGGRWQDMPLKYRFGYNAWPAWAPLLVAFCLLIVMLGLGVLLNVIHLALFGPY